MFSGSENYYNEVSRITVKIRGTATTHLASIVWKAAERIWNMYRIDVYVEDDPSYLVNHLAGVGLPSMETKITLVTDSGNRTLAEFDILDPEEDEEEIISMLVDYMLRAVANSGMSLEPEIEDWSSDRRAGGEWLAVA